tara:strand:+ start:4373 stop:5251 length:879 start_codon:yes stop_codon:yes gene_type:complete
MINDHKEIKNLVPVELSGLSEETDLNLEKKEHYYNIIREHINKNTKHLSTPNQTLNEDGCLYLGNILNSLETKKELENFPIYKGHIKNDLYSDGVPMYDYDIDSLNGIYCWSMQDLIKCKTITNIASNPLIINIVSQYLGCLPTCYGINCMLSVGTSGHGTTRRHRDLDDFKFLSLFIYLDDVDLTNGPHVYESGTHKGIKGAKVGSVLTPIDERPKILVGNAGDGFIEDNWGIHYGMTLQPKAVRRCLWVRYGLYDNYTARTSVNLHKQKTTDHTFNIDNEVTKYIFRFLI